MNRQSSVLLRYLPIVLAGYLIGCYTSSLGQYIYPSYSFRTLSDVHGLSHPNINQCIEDQEGYIWIATKNGLNRYDGEEFYIFKHNPQDSATISSNEVRTLYVDTHNCIWIGTNDKGIDRFDQGQQTFEHFTYSESGAHIPGRINAITSDSLENIWAATNSGLYVLENPAENSVFKPIKLPVGSDSIQTLVYHMLMDDKGWLWAATEHGLFVSPRPDKTPFSRIVMDSTQIEGIPSDRLTHITQDNSGFYWISCFGYGISVLPPITNRMDFNPDQWNFMNLAPGPSFRIPKYPTMMKEEYSGKFIICSPGSLTIYSKEEIDRIRTNATRKEKQHLSLSGGVLSTRANHKFTLPDYSVKDIFTSSFESIWVSTRKGIAQLNPPVKGIQGYSLADQGKKVLLDYVYNLAEEKSLLLFDREKIYLYDIEKGAFPRTYAINSYVGDIRTVYRVNDSIFWIGGYKGLIEFNIHSGNQEVFRFQDYCYEKDCSWLQINEIIEGPLGHTYMATGAGILVFPDNQLTNPYRFFLEDSTSYSNWIKCIAPDGEGLLWVGTNTGLWQVSVEGLEDSSIHSQLMLPSSYLDSYIRDIEVSQTSRTIWIAGENGVSAYEKHSGKSYSLPKIFEEVSFVKLDADETHLWGSTVGRVFVYDVLDSTFKYFNHFDGLNSEYIGNASKSSNDLYIFGSNQGFTHINLAESFSKWRNSPRVCFTRYETKGQSYFINPQTRQAGLKFLPGDDYFTIYFSTLDFAKEGKTYYSYRLTGFDEDWIDINDRNSISYSNLRQGSYSLEVRSSYDGIKWNPQIARIDLEIVPPLWQRTWFQFISVFALSLGIAFWYFQRERQRKARERILEQKVNQKTEDLKRSEQLLERKNQELTKYIESNMQLENFAYLASHDLKSPLQNIINFSQLIERTLANENRPQINMAIQYLNEGAMRMKHTVEDLLNFSLVTNNQINPKWINPEELIEAVLQDISETITQSQAEVSIKSVPKSIPVDESLFRELILNLLTNAIKFVSENSIPKIVISGSTKGSYHNFSVTDNGIGIAKTHKEKIFGIFKRLHSREEYNGTGIGLAICKKIVERHDGKIWVESLGEGMGSTFFFSFPIFPAKKIKDARQRELVSP